MQTWENKVNHWKKWEKGITTKKWGKIVMGKNWGNSLIMEKCEKVGKYEKWETKLIISQFLGGEEA